MSGIIEVRMMSEYITMIENMDVSDLRQISETTFYDTFEGEYSDDDFNQFFKAIMKSAVK